MAKMINGIKKIGIIGGGQLAKMMLPPAQAMGFEVYILDPDKDCGASWCVKHQVVGSFADPDALQKLAELVGKDGVITFDSEHVGVEELRGLQDKGYVIRPCLDSQEKIRDKYLQKLELKKAGLQVAEFEAMRGTADVKEWLSVHGKSVLKARRFSYDGYGNHVVASVHDAEEGFAKLSKNNGGLYIEKFVPYDFEVSVNVARGLNGEYKFYPIVLNEHAHNVLYTTLAPADLSADLKNKIIKAAEKTADAFKGAGNLGVEMFILKNTGEVLINEIAPRPHNSGHFTIEACKTSQFENHIRGVAGLPLGSTDMVDESAMMLNILGEKGQSGEVIFEGAERALELGFKVHLYGKSEVRGGRKMGHMTFVGSKADTMKLYAMRDDIRIRATAKR